MPVKKKSVPINLKLYNRVKSEVKRKVKVWPSAYASGQVVNRYKQLGGRYKYSIINTKNTKNTNNTKNTKKRISSYGQTNVNSGLTRWFKEQWVNVCAPKKNGKYQTCARTGRKYPYCRPLVRVTSKTPRTVSELTRNTIKRRCLRKTSSKRVDS